MQGSGTLHGNLELKSGELEAGGTVATDGFLKVSGGTLRYGPWQVDGRMDLVSGQYLLEYLTIGSTGTLNWTAGTISHSDGAGYPSQLTIQAGGTMNFVGANARQLDGYLINQSSLTLNSQSLTLNGSLTNEGTLNVNGSLSGSHSISNGSLTNEEGTLHVNGGTLNLSGTFVGDIYNGTGSTLNLAANTSFTPSNGYLSNSGTIVIAGPASIDGGVSNSGGTVSISGAAEIVKVNSSDAFYNGGVIDIALGGSLTMAAGTTFLNDSGGSITGTGVLDARLATQTNLYGGSLDGATLKATSAVFANGGYWTFTPSNEFVVNSGNLQIDGASSIVNVGRLRIAGGTLTNNGTLTTTSGHLVVDGGTFNGTGSANLGYFSFIWNGGTLGGSQTITTYIPSMTGTGARVLDGATLDTSYVQLQAGSLELRSGTITSERHSIEWRNPDLGWRDNQQSMGCRRSFQLDQRHHRCPRRSQDWTNGDRHRDRGRRQATRRLSGKPGNPIDSRPDAVG